MKENPVISTITGFFLVLKHKCFSGAWELFGNYTRGCSLFGTTKASRKGQENGINTFIMTMLSLEPRQIVAYAVDNAVKAETIQGMVDGTIQAECYYTDGGSAYPGVDFVGSHMRNMTDKSDTHNIESSNADLRHYIAGLRRRSRCFFRSMETLRAVLYVFVHAFNRFGDAKRHYMQNHPDCKRVYHFNHLAFI